MKRNIVEWLVLATSVVAIIALVGVLVMEGISGSRPAEPRIELHRDLARATATGWLLPATVSNAGDAAAEIVVFEATATVGAEQETDEIAVDFLPSGTEVEIVFAFSTMPDEVSARLVGFRVP